MEKKKGKSKINGKNSASIQKHEFLASTLYIDNLLFKILGLKEFSKIPSNQEYYVGDVEFSNLSTAKIWVFPMPAMFWKFEIYISETKKTVIVSTGSGSLNDFWNSIKLIAENMLEINYKD